MKAPLREKLFFSAVVFGLTAVLVALAVLQYRWSGEVSQAASARLQADLQSSVMGWRDDLYRELTNVYGSLQAGAGLPATEKGGIYAQQYAAWNRRAAHPDLISHVYLWSGAGTKQERLVQLNASSGSVEPSVWPDRLTDLHSSLEALSSEMSHHMPQGNRSHGAGPRMHRPAGHWSQGFDASPPEIDLNTLVLVRSSMVRGPAPPQNASIDWLLVELNKKVLQEHVLPELAERHFSDSQGLAYQVAVLNQGGEPGLIYSSDSDFGRHKISNADQQVQVFGPPFGPSRQGMGPMPGPMFHRPGGPPSHEHNALGYMGPLRIEPLHFSGHQPEWQLAVRHRKGSLDAVVAGARRRNLVVSFGVLLVLAAGMGMIIVMSQRARTLARLQMDFVAAVSHELRTPVAVISSAAENIADGVVSSREQLSQYGNVIKAQARQLIQLIEQILLFASTRQKQHRYNMRPVQVGELVETALGNTASLLQEAGFTVEKKLDANLPPILGDLTALSHCLQNLITNAVKYGGERRWLGIHASADGEGREKEVRITIEDKGLGIESRELQRIFEPFYRSPLVSSAQIHGTGLGLPLAKSIAESMGGKLTVTSEPGQGSAFTVHLPAAESAVSGVKLDLPATANPKFS